MFYFCNNKTFSIEMRNFCSTSEFWFSLSFLLEDNIYCSGLLTDQWFFTPLWLVRVTLKRVLQPGSVAALEEKSEKAGFRLWQKFATLFLPVSMLWF